MRRLWVLCLLPLLLWGCAAEEPTYTVTLHTVSSPELKERLAANGKAVDYAVYGATWSAENACDIYLLPKEEILATTYNYVNADGSYTSMTGAVFYEWLLGHEYRHCLEGSFHP